MTGTPDLRTAYNGNMEMLIVAVMLAYAEKDETFRRSLGEVLDFYRKNRELFQALLQEKRNTGGEKDENPEKNSPPAEGESLRVLDEFLRKI